MSLVMMGEYERTITIDPGDGRQVVQGPQIDITGKAPPFALPSWWPWVVAAIAIGGLWYLTREGKGSGPLAEAG